jgi:hypothetical protein
LPKHHLSHAPQAQQHATLDKLIGIFNVVSFVRFEDRNRSESAEGSTEKKQDEIPKPTIGLLLFDTGYKGSKGVVRRLAIAGAVTS